MTTVAQYSFTGGEISPQAAGRADLEKFASSVQKMQNFVPLIHGPVTRRVGTQLRSVVKHDTVPYIFNHWPPQVTSPARIIEYTFDDDNRYVIELGYKYARFYKNGVRYNHRGTFAITDVTWPTFWVVITAPGHTFEVGERVYINGLADMSPTAPFPPSVVPRLNGKEYRVRAINGNDFEINVENFILAHVDPYPGGAGATATGVFDLVTPYDEEEVFDVDTEFSGNTVFLAHGDHRPAKFIRLGAGTKFSYESWEWLNIQFDDGPFDFENTDDTSRLTPPATTGAQTIALESAAIAVCDTATDKVYFLRSDGTLIAAKGALKFGALETIQVNPLYTGPLCVLWAKDDTLWWAYTGGTVILHTQKDGVLVGNTVDQIPTPGGVAIRGITEAADGTLWTVSTASPAVIANIKKNGEVLNTFLSTVIGGGVNALEGISYDPTDDTLWAYCLSDGKFYNFTQTGTAISSFLGTAVDAAATTSWSVACGDDDTLWGSCAITDKVYNFSKVGVKISEFSRTVFDAGATNLTGISFRFATNSVNDGVGFTSDDVGRLLAIKHSSTIGVARITAVDNSGQVQADILSPFGATDPSASWRLGSWYDAAGYPKLVVLDNERLWWLSSAKWPTRMWGSKLGVYLSHIYQATPVESDAVDVEIGGQNVNAIHWAVSGSKFAIGTTGAEYWASGSAGGSSLITNLDKRLSVGSRNGSDNVPAIMVGNTVIHVEKHSKVLRELRYSFEQESFSGEDLTALAEHLTREYGIVELAYQSTPYKCIWCRRSDGKLLGLTYYPEHNIFGWHYHSIAGTDAVVESITKAQGDSNDELWLVVARTVNGLTQRTVESIGAPFNGVDTDDATFLDCWKLFDNRQTVTSITYGTDTINLSGHGYSNGDEVTFRTSDRLFDSDTSLHYESFFVANAAAGTFKLEDSLGNPIDLAPYDPSTRTPAVKLTITVAKKMTTLTGLWEYEGESVNILGDGAEQVAQTVTDGKITLPTAASVVYIGYGYNADLELWPPGYVDKDRSVRIRKKRITALTSMLYKTVGFKYGKSFESLYAIPTVSDAVPLGQPAPLFTGTTVDYELNSGYGKDVHVCIRIDGPYPGTFLSTYQEVEIEHA